MSLPFSGAAAMTSGPPPVGAVALTSSTASDFDVAPGSAYAAISFSPNGILTVTEGASSSNIIGQWWSIWPVTDIGSSYQIRATLVSGTAPTGPALGSTTWHNLSTPREWSHSRSTSGTSAGVIEVSIRDTATSTIQATAQCTIQAIIEN